MKKTTLLTFLTAMTVTITFAQITTTKVASKIEVVTDNSPYDSLDNFVGKNVRKYIGQELYLKCQPEGLRNFGYREFVNDYTKVASSNKSNVYKCCDNFNSKYDALNGKYFKVLDVYNHPKAKENEQFYGSQYFLKLEEKESKDIVYYEYTSTSNNDAFPFVVVGYFAKSKDRYIRTEYILRGRNWIDKKPEMLDIQTGKPVDYSAGSIWKCVDFTIEEKYCGLCLILENSKGEKVAYSMSQVWNGYTYFGFPKSDADKYKEKFGSENWDLVLAGNVKIGMTKEMCQLAWGKPKNINQTITEGKKTEQWVYSENYLYFDNDILTVIQ